MKLTRQQFAIAGVIGAVAVTAPLANAATSSASAAGSGNVTTAASGTSSRLHVSIVPGTCTSQDVTKHRQVSSVTITTPDDRAYDVGASIENRPGTLGGVEDPGLVRYAAKNLNHVGPGKTVRMTLRWPARVHHSYLAATAQATTALGGDVKNVKLGGPHGRHNYSTQCAGSPTLGLAHWGGAHTRGFGKVRPAILDNGGDPTGLVTKLSWATWGGRTAQGTGITTYVPPGKTVAQGIPTRATVRAYDLTTCGGHRAYRHVTWWFPSKGETYTWAMKHHVEHFNLCAAS